jgi:hypothetical protein
MNVSAVALAISLSHSLNLYRTHFVPIGNLTQYYMVRNIDSSLSSISDEPEDRLKLINLTAIAYNSSLLSIHQSQNTMPSSRQLSNILSLSLATFHSFCAQAHLTSKLTPTFSKLVEDSIPQHNEKVLWFLSVSDYVLNYIFLAINVLIVVLVVPPRSRKLGLCVALFFLCVGFYADLKLGESPAPHVVLIAIAGGALALR